MLLPTAAAQIMALNTSDFMTVVFVSPVFLLFAFIDKTTMLRKRCMRLGR